MQGKLRFRGMLINLNVGLDSDPDSTLREPAKKVPPLVVRPPREGVRALVVVSLVEELFFAASLSNLYVPKYEAEKDP